MDCDGRSHGGWCRYTEFVIVGRSSVVTTFYAHWSSFCAQFWDCFVRIYHHFLSGMNQEVILRFSDLTSADLMVNLSGTVSWLRPLSPEPAVDFMD